jgi:hypothetical protein
LADDNEHMIGVKCPNGHICYYDKRVLCRGEHSVVRALEDEIWVECRQCDAEMIVRVDCRRYR